MSRDLLICLALACLALLLYAPVRDHDFINYDDPGYVNEEHVQRGLTIENVRWALTTTNFSNWHPLTWLSHMTDVSLFGNNAGAHHIVSVVFHAINTVLLYLVLRALTGRPWESLAVASLWTVHPLRVESVAWIAERKDLLSALFFLLAIAAYARYVRRKSWWAYAAVLACLALGLASKSMIVTLPFVLLLLDVWPLRRGASWRRLIFEKAPLFVLAAGSAVVTYFAQRQGGAMNAGAHIPLGIRLANALSSFARYLELTVWPRGLAVFYPYPGTMDDPQIPAARVIIGVALVVGGIAAAALLWRRQRAVMIGWLWFLGTLVPVIGLVQVGRQSMADRYTYIPHMGLFIAVVWAAAMTGAHVGGVLATRRLGLGVLAVALVALAARTHDQLRHWRDSGTLFSHALRVTERNTVALVNYALVLVERGETDAAMDHYRRALEIAPHDPFIHFNAARVLARAGRHEESVRHSRQAIRLAPDNFAAHYEFAVDLAERGQVQAALPEFEVALRLRPEMPQLHYAYGLALREAGQTGRAIKSFRRAAQLARERRDQRLLSEIEAQITQIDSSGAPAAPLSSSSSAAAGTKPSTAPVPATNPAPLDP